MQCADDRERRIYLQKLNHAYETIAREAKPAALRAANCCPKSVGFR